MPTVNERLQSGAIGHAIALGHYGNGAVRRVMAALNDSDPRLFAELMDAIDAAGPEGFSMERLQRLLSGARAVNRAAFEAAAREMIGQLRELVAYETDYQQKALHAAMPAGVAIAAVATATAVSAAADVSAATSATAAAPERVAVKAVSADEAIAAAARLPFQGVLLSGVWDDLGGQRMKVIQRTIAQGMVESRPTAEIVRQLRGTRAAGYADGLIDRSRREVEAVVRTAAGHYAGVAQDAVMAANADLVKAVMWVSTLDTRTTEQCAIRDGLTWTPDTHEPIGHGVPWGAGPGRLHWNCRSTQVPITKSWREMGIDMDEVPPGERASMDGKVPGSTTYLQWLGQQSAARQDEVLGPVRGKLYRGGDLALGDMYSNKGQWLTLDQLRARDARAFERAGL